MTKIISLNSIKGGVGQTTVAKELAMALIKHNKKVLLIDGDMEFGDMRFLFNIKTDKDIEKWGNDIEYLFNHGTNSDDAYFSKKEIFREYLIEDKSGLFLLLSPNTYTTYMGLNFMKTIIKNLRHCEFDYIVVDNTYISKPEGASVLIQSDIILLLTSTNPSELVHIQKVYDFLERNLEIKKDKINLIFNKWNNNCDVSTIHSYTKIEPLHLIPYYSEIREFNEKRMSLVLNTKNEFTDAIISLALKIV